MTSPGLYVKIEKKDFCEKTPEEQMWLLFEAVTRLDQHGCQWAQRTYGSSFWKKMYAIGAGAGAGAAFITTLLAKIIHI